LLGFDQPTNSSAPVAQGIEHRPPEAGAQVRILSGAPLSGAALPGHHWHYQWLLVNEHLPQIAGHGMVSNVLTKGNKFYKPPAGDAFMPIEFAAACYRFGHSMVRPSYRPTSPPAPALHEPHRKSVLRGSLLKMTMPG
jgi:hypothetical protein